MADSSTTHYVNVAVPIPVAGAFTYRVPEGETCPVGSRVIVPVGKRKLTGYVVEALETPPDLETIKVVERVVDVEPIMDDHFIQMGRWMASMYVAGIGEVLSAMTPGGKKPRDLPAESGDEPRTQTALELSDEQQSAIEAILSRTDPGSEAWYYLYGITGSGKTEVFLQAAEHLLGSGKGTIYLVPEIALTHQLFERIAARFHGRAAVLHSGLTPSQRLAEWRRILRGEAMVVVGARSAVFAPVRNLGLIVIDEEHESSYKNGNTPRYHARQVAMWRSKALGARLVMGSATPSVEAWHLMETGRLTRLELTRRLSGGRLPAVKIYDVRRCDGLLSPTLLTALRETKSLGAQSILFLNRRGFGHVLHCRSCGYQMECPRCSVSLTYHKDRDTMQCHYCGYQTTPMTACSSCSSLDVGYMSFGTERVEEEVEQKLPGLTVARLDTDATQKRGVLKETIERFARGEIDLLLGTQMVAKGLNFPGVRTVGIVLADTGLNLPDFRAAERTFSLIVQVAGRAGRFRTDGQVLVQSLKPDHPSIVQGANHQIDAFYRAELATRRDLGFPPFARLVRLVIRSKRRDLAVSESRRIADLLSRYLPEGGEVLGPSSCALERIQRNWRWQVLLRVPRMGSIQSVIRSILADARTHHRVYVEVDVDPVNLL